MRKPARRAGLSKALVREYLPYRMLEVEVAANTVHAWAAQDALVGLKRDPVRQLDLEHPREVAGHLFAHSTKERSPLRPVPLSRGPSECWFGSRPPRC